MHRWSPPYAPLQVFFLLKKVGLLRYNDHKMLCQFQVYSFMILTFGCPLDPSSQWRPQWVWLRRRFLVPCPALSVPQCPVSRGSFSFHRIYVNWKHIGPTLFCLVSFTQLIILRFSLTFAWIHSFLWVIFPYKIIPWLTNPGTCGWTLACLLIVVAVTDEAAVSIMPEGPCGQAFSLPLGKRLAVPWLCTAAGAHWASRDTARPSSSGCRACAHQRVWGSTCPTSSQPLGGQSCCLWWCELCCGAPVGSAVLALMTNTCWHHLALVRAPALVCGSQPPSSALFLFVWRIVHIFSVQVLYEVCFLQVFSQTVACVLIVFSGAFWRAEILNFDDVRCTSFSLMDSGFMTRLISLPNSRS